MDFRRSYYLNRTLCDVLEGMRDCVKTQNFSSLAGLIEEAQLMGNRMESALSDKHDMELMNEEWHKLKTEIKKLRKKRRKLMKQVGEKEGEDDG